MSLPLEYRISVVGGDQLKRVLRGVEREVAIRSNRVGDLLKRTDKAAASQTRSRVRRDEFGFRQIGRVAEREQMRRARVADRFRRQEQNKVLNGFAEIGRAAKAADSARHREVMRNLRTERSFARRVGSKIGTATTQGIGRVGGKIGNVAMLGATGFGAFAAGNAVRSRAVVNAASADLANQAFGNPRESRSREQLQDSVRKQVASIDQASGLGEENIIRGLRQFVAISGELGKAQKLLPHLAQLADASGADIGDVGRTAGQALLAVQISGVTDPGKQLSEVTKIMGAVAGQAKIGSIEMADMAQQMGKLTSASGRFAGGAADMVALMGAFGQKAIAGGAASADEAMTALMRLPDNIAQNQDKFAGLGVDVFTDSSRTKIKNPLDIILETLKATEGDITKVQKLFKLRAMKAFQPLQDTFVNAGGGTAGIAAVERSLAPLLKATLTDDDIAKSSTFRRSQEDRRFKRVVGEFNRAIGDQLLPELTKGIPQFKEMIPVLGDVTSGLARLLGWLVENPWKGLGAAVALKIGASLATAKIGEVVARAMSRSIPTSAGLGSAGPGMPVSGVVSGGGRVGKGGHFKTSVSTALGSVAIGVTVGLAVKDLLEGVGKQAFDDAQHTTAVGRKQLLWARSHNPDDIGRLQSGREKAARDLQKVKDSLSFVSADKLKFINPALPMIRDKLLDVTGFSGEVKFAEKTVHGYDRAIAEALERQNKMIERIDRVVSGTLPSSGESLRDMMSTFQALAAPSRQPVPPS